MAYKIVQFLAFAAVVAAPIISGTSKTDYVEVHPDASSIPLVSDDKNKSAVPEIGSIPEIMDKIKSVTPTDGKIIGVSEKPAAVSIPNPAPPQKNTEGQYPAISPDDLAEKPANLQSITLIKCIFRTQYYEQSSQPWGEERFALGSGVVISPNGLILTARHIFEVPEDMLNDPAGRIWTRKKCEVALTDKDVSPISTLTTAGKPVDPRFQEAEIVFMASDSDYIGAKGIDLAVLKIKTDGEISHADLFRYLLEFREKDPIILIGYPGRDSLVSQQLERFDGQFVTITYYEESLCGISGKPCGLRYILRRYPTDYEKDFWKKTDLGIVTPYFRGGFSGAPAFYKGNLIGIATHGISGSDAADGWDQAVILTSWDIFEFLSSNSALLN